MSKSLSRSRNENENTKNSRYKVKNIAIISKSFISVAAGTGSSNLN